MFSRVKTVQLSIATKLRNFLAARLLYPGSVRGCSDKLYSTAHLPAYGDVLPIVIDLMAAQFSSRMRCDNSGYSIVSPRFAADCHDINLTPPQSDSHLDWTGFS
jgi:hypothetical protein